MSTEKVRLTVKSWKRKVGDEIEVESALAEQLFRNGQAAYSDPKKQAAASKKLLAESRKAAEAPPSA